MRRSALALGVNDTSGSAQAGSPTVFAPVRVLSRGIAPGGEPDAGDTIGELLGELLASPSGVGDDLVATPSGVAPTGPRARNWPSPEELRRLLDGADSDPTVRLVSEGAGIASGRGEFATLGVSAASLPLTGLHSLAVMGLGMWLLATGALASRLIRGGKAR
jgi:hypothetical protein